jgi:hypothetical protein
VKCARTLYRKKIHFRAVETKREVGAENYIWKQRKEEAKCSRNTYPWNTDNLKYTASTAKNANNFNFMVPYCPLLSINSHFRQFHSSYIHFQAVTEIRVTKMKLKHTGQIKFLTWTERKGCVNKETSRIIENKADRATEQTPGTSTYRYITFQQTEHKPKKQLKSCKIPAYQTRGWNARKALKDSSLLRYDAVSNGQYLPTFRRSFYCSHHDDGGTTTLRNSVNYSQFGYSEAFAFL